jgi:hypothetical protein
LQFPVLDLMVGKQDYTGWSEPAPGRELHPLKSGAFHGALLRQQRHTLDSPLGVTLHKSQLLLHSFGRDAGKPGERQVQRVDEIQAECEKTS